MSGITRTTDGYLWLGSQLGLFRFNGLRFEAYKPPPGVTFPSSSILNVLGTRDGGLWVSFSSFGAAYIKESKVQLFEAPDLKLHSFTEDLNGRVWATSLDHVRYFDGIAWREYVDPVLSGRRIWSLFCDRSGGLWGATDKGLIFLPRGKQSFHQVGPSRTVTQVGQSPDGELWMADWSGHIRTVFGTTGSGRLQPLDLGVSASFLFDRDGSIWGLTGGKGVVRQRLHNDGSHDIGDGAAPGVEWFASKDGLSDNFIANAIEDPEGSIWIATLRGLDRFRYSAFAPMEMNFPAKDFTLLASQQGGIWAGSSASAAISLLHIETAEAKGPRTRVASVCRDSKGIVWWGAQGGIWRQEGDRFSFYPQPKQLPIDFVWQVIPANETGGLWVRMGDVGLMHFKNGIWSGTEGFPGLPSTSPSAAFHENELRSWFGYRDNRVLSLDRGKVKVYTAEDGVDVGRVRTIQGNKGLVWIGGDVGLELLLRDRFIHIRATDATPIGQVNGIVEASDGSLWLNEIHGLLRISSADIKAVLNNPGHVVAPRKFDSLDGLPGAGQSSGSSTILEANDGRIWIATDGGIAWADFNRPHVNTFKPPVFVTGVHTNTENYSYDRNVKLAAGTTTVRFTYEAMSLSMPERVRFRYILHGVNDYWHDAVSSRDATYNNLSPGQYQFVVIASNSDGIWSPTSASIDFSILPLFYQTLWFRLLVLVVSVMLLWILFLVRLHQSNERIEAKLSERMMERDRIARELHDTLLQGFQMLVLRFQVIADTIAPENHLRSMMEDSLSRAEHSLQEGRDKVGALRSESEPGDDLAADLARFGHEATAESESKFRLTIEGGARPIHSVVYEDIQMIAREAITNASRHAGATIIECVIQFAPRHFLFVCRDNGCGISKDMLEGKGRRGHWGLIGMQERAANIGGSLRVTPVETGGTQVELRLKSGIAYASEIPPDPLHAV
ncbi:sensor histidine kinase [Terriglobus sp. TAA 43]|uniref:sensor histidine kinase n=1 Tax=Terriglobus sp. TAA 43 TaxID=278961 RepID=UPI0006455DA3|nr:sensor histidine kinase [Terriglobus sp. TAA 43]